MTRLISLRNIVVVYCLILLPVQAQDQLPHNAIGSGNKLIYVERGTIPIILTAPHGGQEKIPGVPERSTGTTVRDDKTIELALALVSNLEKLIGRRPYIVMAEFARLYIDVNRNEKEAFEVAKAAPVYHAYHSAIRGLVDEIRTKWPGKALLIDIHGQSKYPDSIVRGTRDGRTEQMLIRRAGKKALIGPKSIFGKLEEFGYEIIPPGSAESQAEDPEFSGGYTVVTYGSNKPDGIDSIQIETGRNIRIDSSRRDKYAKDLAKAVAVFYQEYLRPAH